MSLLVSVPALALARQLIADGRIVEVAPADDIYRAPKHPYTRALMASMPAMNSTAKRLTEIPGIVPPLGNPLPQE